MNWSLGRPLTTSELEDFDTCKCGSCHEGGYLHDDFDHEGQAAFSYYVLTGGFITEGGSDLRDAYYDEPEWRMPGDHILNILFRCRAGYRFVRSDIDP